MDDAEVCCGFGGLFCVRYADISNQMVSRKMNNIEVSGADTLLAGDLGCLLNMAGKLTRQGSRVRVRHVEEVLAGMTDLPAIGEEAPGSSPDAAPDRGGETQPCQTPPPSAVNV